MEMDNVTKSSNIPPKQGFSKVQQIMANRSTGEVGRCPSEDVCRREGIFIEGVCMKRPAGNAPCLVACVKLLDRLVNKN
jgi:hypothetical protein